MTSWQKRNAKYNLRLDKKALKEITSNKNYFGWCRNSSDKEFQEYIEQNFYGKIKADGLISWDSPFGPPPIGDEKYDAMVRKIKTREYYKSMTDDEYKEFLEQQKTEKAELIKKREKEIETGFREEKYWVEVQNSKKENKGKKR